ncbi:response regulator [Pseudooceanicola algae]|uniref:Uncharacterized protein n=1 Tax=Pseudooceanicola algae TaxID=1537215 RepID=A0A418SJX1_9RHOB|nr:response regulator [Pseudooceanicola algae]QPM92240.1 hypothetical protein PSAL_035040 [Pseudooceanicola algae]
MARILVMEDDEDQADCLAECLVRMGHKVDIALTSDKAIGAVDTGAFDLVVADIFIRERDVMVGNGGLRLIRHIREGGRGAPATCRDVPVIAMSGVLGGPTDGHFLALAGQAGADLELQKPILPARLSEAIESLLLPRETT